MSVEIEVQIYTLRLLQEKQSTSSQTSRKKGKHTKVREVLDRYIPTVEE